MTVLEDLFYGNLSPLNEYEHSKETVNATRKNNKKIAVLKDYLHSDIQRYALDKLIDNQSTLIALTEKDAFLAGFKLGVKVMAEVFGDN